MGYFSIYGTKITKTVKYMVISVLSVHLTITVLTGLRNRSDSSMLIRDERQANRELCFRHVQTAFMDIFHNIVKPKSTVVILSTVVHPNLGDYFIWLGEEMILQKSGCEVVYRCPTPHCQVEKIGSYLRRSNRTTICMHGGGNFGDLYPTEANKKLKFLMHFLIIQL
jgi:exopolysaccharide biosynthesis predicted pyruvyltransferase EpsI